MALGGQSRHIRRQRRTQMQNLSGNRMGQRQRAGVEGGAGDQRWVLCAVKPISGQRTTDKRHMEPQLMGAAGLWNQPQKRETSTLCQYLIVGDGCGTIRPDAAADGGAFIPANRRVNGACRGSGAAQADGSVLPIKTLGMQLTAQ